MTTSAVLSETLVSLPWELDSYEIVPKAQCAAPATLRVLHVVNGELYAGRERVQDLLAARLPEFGVEVAFACIKPDKFPTARRSQSTALVNLPMRSRFDLRPAWRLAKMVRQEQFDVIHTHTPRAALVGQIARGWPACRWCIMCMVTRRLKLGEAGAHG